MKVRALVAISGADINAGHGAVVDMEDDEAKRYIAAGFVEPVTTPKPKKVSAKKK